MNREGKLAWRNRIVSLGSVGLYLGVVHAVVDDPTMRAQFNYGVVITLGYGHLVGAAFFSRKRFIDRLSGPTRYLAAHTGRAGVRFADSPPAVQRVAWSLLSMGTVALVYAGYLTLLKQSPGAWLPMLAISIWHTVENSENLEGFYRTKRQLTSRGDKPKSHLVSLGASVCLMAWGLILIRPDWTAFALSMRILTLICGATLLVDPRQPNGRKWLGLILIGAGSLPPHWLLTRSGIDFSDLFAASILYHLVSWGVLSLEKSFRSDAPDHMKRDMAVIHLLPLGMILGTFAWPAPWGSAIRADFIAPTSYLFWSVIHVLQTAWLRGHSPSQRRLFRRPSLNRKTARRN
ncbi:MAG: hypothetical protein VX252_13250 [Myxococcota bacterium]|nr:hypothetical protein [Myxococcota bacterium]